MGHSYGGILVANVLKHWNADIPLEVHVVASPLLGMTMFKKICGYEPIEVLPNNSSLLNGGLSINLIAHLKIYQKILSKSILRAV